jgi:hypothetical protein
VRTNFVFVDLENVQPDSLALLNREYVKVFVFVGANQPKIPFEFADSMQRLGDKAQYLKISGSGRNALDFHVAFYIGQFATQDPTAYFHIVSKDKGFKVLIKHLKSRKILAAQSTDVREIPFIKQASNLRSKSGQPNHEPVLAL